MKMKQILKAALLCLGLAPAAQAQTFGQLWKNVDQAEKNGLPQTVVKLTEEIFRKGEKEKNSPQMLKAYLWRMNYRETLSPDSVYTDLKGLEEWAVQADKPTDRAILHSLIAGFYADYAADNRWQLRRRTDIAGEAPAADVREWTASMFIDKVQTHVKEALADSALLLTTSSQTYIPFVTQGKTSEYYHHTLYHLLASHGIASLRKVEDLLPAATAGKGESNPVKRRIASLYEKMLAAYEAAGMEEGCVLTALDCLEWKWDSQWYLFPKIGVTATSEQAEEAYLSELEALKKRYAPLPICAEIYRVQALHFIGNNRPTDALRLCDEAIRLYPKYARINELKNQRSDILAPSIQISAPSQVFPGEELKLTLWHKNIDGFTVRLYQDKKLVTEQHYALQCPADYRVRDSLFTFKAPDAGAYVMRVVADGRTKEYEEHDLSVTRFKVLTATLPKGQCGVLVFDARTGHPIADATVTLYNNKEEKLQEFTTDKDGKVTFPKTSDYNYLKATKGEDTRMKLQYFYIGRFGYYSDKRTETVTLLTDRSLYRPGQTVYVKGIAYAQQSDTASVLPDKEYTVTLLDANRQEVGKKAVRTNGFGSFTADFTLPSACLNGMFSLQAGEGRANIRVEEYKRPTFDITFDKQTGSYRLGDEVQLKGNLQSYSGVSLQGLPVKYTVRRSSYHFWRVSESVQTASGEVTADADGRFTIPVRLEEGDTYKNNEQTYYRYSIEATATNAAGETQSSTETIAAGTRTLVLNVELPDKLCKSKEMSAVFSVRNLNGQPVDATGSYALYAARGEKPDEIDESPVAEGTFASNGRTTLDWKRIPSGAYLLKASVKDEQGREVTTEARTVLFHLSDRRPPVQSPLWLYVGNAEFDAAHPAEFCVGTSEKDAYVLMNVFCKNRLVSEKWLHLTDSIVRFRYPYREWCGDGLSFNFCLVRNGEVHQEQMQVKKRLLDKTLAMKWDVFRDKLRPGQQEEWRLTVKTPKGNAAQAEMLATMYDASLDKLWNRRQGLQVNYRLSVPNFNWSSGHVPTNMFYNWWKSDLPLRVPELAYDYFAVLPGNFMMRSNIMIRGYGARQKSALAGSMATRNGPVEVKYVPVAVADGATNVEFQSAQVQLADESASGGETLPEATDDLRTNLAETAFFYPQLRTNEQGEISFSFTMPESLTSWNFRGYAHTKDMLTGVLDGKATTSKEFMLTPNLPRFVRVGDETAIAASLSNLTGEPQAGTVSLTLFDPVTEKVISTQKQKFSLAAGKTAGVSFRFTVGDRYNVLGCRMIADSKSFSDGEQHLIPVLSNREHLIETLPIPIRGEEKRTFSLDSLFNRQGKTATNRKLTVEFTGNPAWYAVQALPSLALPENNSALSWATVYYANELASFILNSQPKIKAVFDSWKLQGGTKETFLSNLQKNQEVKNIILSESPWVLDAQTEQQQKERIATLFDLNNVRINHVAALTRLQELQGIDGAWSWYKGMNGSRYVTAYIAGLNARLALLTGKKPEGVALTLQQKALVFLHQEALDEYKEMLKAQKEGVKFTGVSNSILQYLYIVAITGGQVPEANRTAYAYYLSKVGELLTSTSMDTKAMAAVVLDKAGRKEEAQAFVASLKEHLTRTDEQGMFFAFNENPYIWGGMQLRAHVDVMEALGMIGGSDDTVEEMKLWLLKHKQTQQWNSPVATADAVYALLMKGKDLLDRPGDVRIELGNEVLETLAPETSAGVPGLGYVKQSFTQKRVVSARSVKVEKKNPGLAWGAVYAECDVPMNDVKQHGGELNVQKQLYVERMVDNRAQLQPITAETTLRVGDKVVSRLIIRTDRSMDFVQLKDRHGACFEPMEAVSGYRWGNGIGYYTDIKDASTYFFFDHLGKGVYLLEHSYRVSRAGNYEAGLATMQCAYAPEYASHSEAMTVLVAD